MHEKNYRIISLLYLAILILPLAFYFAFSKLHQVESYSLAIRELGRSGGDMLALPLRENGERKILQKKIDTKIAHLGSWVHSLGNHDFYVGDTTPQQDFRQFQSCWQELKKAPSSPKALECWEKDKRLIFSMERMGALQLGKFKNILYLTLSTVTGLLILLVFAIRAFIRRQLRRHAITDEKTGLYNQKYCRAAFSNLCAQARRSGDPLSALSFDVEGLNANDTIYTDSQQGRLLQEIGSYLQEITRKSDLSCRFGENLFLMILPNTPSDGAEILANRIRQDLTDRIRKDFGDFTMRIKMFTKEKDEKCDEYLLRITEE